MKAGLIICLLFAISLGTHAHPGIGILEDSKGNVFYTDLKQVWRITPSGEKSVVVPGVHTHELYLDDKDNLYGEHLWFNGESKDTWRHYVWKLSSAGKLEKVIPDSEGFLEDYSFVRDHFGRMYWADRSKPCQTLVRKEGSAVKRVGNDCFENVRFMHEADGFIYLVDFQDLKKVDARGTTTTVASKIVNKRWTKSSHENLNSIMGIWTDRTGNLFAAVASERQVRKFSADGKEEIVYQTSFPWSPSGGMVDARGNLWVLEYNVINDVRVEKIEPNKKKTVY